MDKPLHHYQTLHELFIRRLNPSARPVDQQKDSVVSPVDAKIEAYGVITPQKEMIVKNKPYSIQEMVSNDLILEKYIEGQFIILYLSPKDYHRIHSPLKAQVGNTWTVGQKVLSSKFIRNQVRKRTAGEKFPEAHGVNI